jgi:predicted ATPase
VLDNCEHLLDAVVPFVERIRTRCHQVHVLATSREPLGLPGEVVWPILPLAIAPPDVADADEVAAAPAVQLLLDRAAAAVPGFVLTEANAPILAELCRRLDGLPLALELAAARFRSLTPETIVERLGVRSRLLDAGPRSLDARHRTLRDTIDWSYDLLSPAERALFLQLAVFDGSFDLDAVEAVCEPVGDQAVEPGASSDPVDVLVALVDKSMVQMVDRRHSRYQLLETLREYGREHLEDQGIADQVNDRHLRWFSRLAEQAGDGLAGSEEAAWSRRVEADFDNFRSAHARAVRIGDVDAALRLVAGLREYSFRRIRYELTSWAATAVLRPGAVDHPCYPVVLATVSYGHYVRGDLEAAVEVGQRAVAAQEATGLESSGLAERALGNALFYLGRTDEALAWMDRMVASARTSGAAGRLAHALYMRSVAETSVGRTVRGAVLAGEAQAAAGASGSPTAMAQAAYALGLALEGTEPNESLRLLRHAADTGAGAGNRWVEAFAQTEVWWLEARMGDVRRALAGSGAVIDTWHRGGDWANLWLSLRHVFGILQQTGDHQAAAVLHGALSRAGAIYALPFEPSDAEHLAEVVEQIRRQLGPDAFDRATSDGAALTEPALVAYIQERIAALTAPNGF